MQGGAFHPSIEDNPSLTLALNSSAMYITEMNSTFLSITLENGSLVNWFNSQEPWG